MQAFFILAAHNRQIQYVPAAGAKYAFLRRYSSKRLLKLGGPIPGRMVWEALLLLRAWLLVLYQQQCILKAVREYLPRSAASKRIVKKQTSEALLPEDPNRAKLALRQRAHTCPALAHRGPNACAKPNVH